MKNLIDEIIEKRKNYKDFYVLHYDTKTTEYHNEIVFMTLSDAIIEYLGNEPINVNDRVELVFSPEDDDEEFSDNVVLMSKMLGGRVVVLKDIDDNTDTYVSTNAPSELVKCVFDNRFELSDERNLSLFEYIQEQIKKQGYFFEETKLERYLW